MSIESKVILIGGNGLNNRKWALEIFDSFSGISSDLQILYYKHWENQDKEAVINLNVESERLYEILKQSQDFIIVAKSVGIVLTMKTILKYNLKPKFCLFLGFPKYWLDEKQIEYLDLIKNFTYKYVLVQNNNDPYCSIQDAKALFQNNSKHIEIIERDENSHNYDEKELYKKLILEEK